MDDNLNKNLKFNEIDWEGMWRADLKHPDQKDISEREIWDERADGFSKRIDRLVSGQEELDKDDYISKMLERIEVQPDWTVLDIGCGPGTLTIPLAKKVKSITALDISSVMLSHLKDNAANSGITNIRYLNSSWEEACETRQVGQHDVVVASRSLMTEEIKDALACILAVCGRAAYLTFPIIRLPLDREVYQAIGRQDKKHPPYVLVYNLLFQMGVQANLEIISSKTRVRFASIEEAINVMQRRKEPFNQEEMTKLKDFFKKKFAEQKGSSIFTHEGKSKWALIWWKMEEQGQGF